MEMHFLSFFLAQLAKEFAWICDYLQASCMRYALKNFIESSFTQVL